METIYKQDLNDEYLILEDVGELQEDYRFHMLLSNHIKGILPCSVRSVDHNLHFYYLTTGKMSLEDFLSQNKANGALVRKFLSSVLELENRCADYLLDISNVILLPQYIFLQNQTFSYCYLPIHKGNPSQDIHSLIGMMLEHGDYEDEEGIALLYKLHSNTRDKYNLKSVIRAIMTEEKEMKSEEGVRETLKMDQTRNEKTLAEHFRNSRQEEETNLNLEILYGEHSEEEKESLFMKILHFFSHSGKKKEKNDIEDTVPEKKMEVHEKKMEVPEKKMKEKELFSEKKLSRTVREDTDLEEWEDFQEDPPTTFLYVAEETSRQMLGLMTPDGVERILIDHTPFVIGSGSSGVDGFVGNPTVSRRHCKISESYDAYYIQDLSSMNGTFLNGKRLQGNEKQKISPGDVIKIAGKEYVVRSSSGRLKKTMCFQ